MHIMILHQDLFFQGGQNVAATLATGLAARGHRVTVVVSKVHEDIQRSNPEAKPFPIPDTVSLCVLPHRRALRNVFALAALIRHLRPDVLMPNVGHYFRACVLARLLAWVNTPLVYVEHNLSVLHKPAGWSRAVSRFFLRRAARIVAVSDGIRECLTHWYGVPEDRVVRIYNPVLGPSFERRLAMSPTHPWLLEKLGFMVVAAGALVVGKNFETLIRAFQIFRDMEPKSQARLLIFGRGPLRETLERLIRQAGAEAYIALAGYSDSIPACFQAADLVVSASRRETFGLVLAEALCAGTPVVSADCPVGPSEILKGGLYGQLVPVDDAEAMAEAIGRVYRGEWHGGGFDPTPYREETVLDSYGRVLESVCHG